MIGRTLGCVATSLILTLGSAHAAPFIYPQKGQDQKQQDADSGACQAWAKGQTGFDPMNPTAGLPAPPPPAPVTEGGVVKGGARGAALGAIGGAVAGDAGKGAAAGAAVGAAAGGMKRADAQRQAAAAQQAAQQQQQAALAAAQANFDRAFAACMEGRGYTVK